MVIAMHLAIQPVFCLCIAEGVFVGVHDFGVLQDGAQGREVVRGHRAQQMALGFQDIHIGSKKGGIPSACHADHGRLTMTAQPCPPPMHREASPILASRLIIS